MPKRPRQDDAEARRARKAARIDAGSWTGDIREGGTPMRTCACPDCVKGRPERAGLAKQFQKQVASLRSDLRKLRKSM